MNPDPVLKSALNVAAAAADRILGGKPFDEREAQHFLETPVPPAGERPTAGDPPPGAGAAAPFRPAEKQQRLAAES